MSSCSSDMMDCNDKLHNISQSKKKSKKKKVPSSRKDSSKFVEKQKSFLKNTHSTRKKKISIKGRYNERLIKCNDIDQSDPKNNHDNYSILNKIFDPKENLKFSNSSIVKSSLETSGNSQSSYNHCDLLNSTNTSLKEISGESDDSDKCERVRYIKLLSKLIDLNMPSKIESSRSNEAYSKRQCFLEKRRFNSEKTESCTQLFCSESFWLELQHRVQSRKEDTIKRMKDKTMSILKEFVSFKVLDTELDQIEVPKDKTYAISKHYLSKIKLAHAQVSSLLIKYYYHLSFWPTTIAMQTTIQKNHQYYVDHYQEINENIETMQAWQNCCHWLNWKTHQICQLVGISGKCLEDFIIMCYQNAHNYNYENNDECEIFSNANDVLFHINENEHQSTEKRRLRSHSLNMTMDYMKPTSLITNDTREETLCDSDCELKFETYADINRRRYGLEKVCSSAIDSVRPILIKYKNLFSITKDDNTLPFMHSYAQAVKDGNYEQPLVDKRNGSQLIYTENHSCQTSCQTAKPVFDANLEFPVIPPKNPLPHGVCSPSLSSHPSLSCMGQEDLQEDISEDSFQQIHDGLRKDSEQEQMTNQRESDKYLESKGLFGLKNHVAARLGLPPLLPHYLFLAGFPIKIMQCCIRKLLSSADMSKISELSVLTIKQRIIDYKDALQYTMQAREFLFKCEFGINFQINRYHSSNFKDFAPKQDIDLSDFMRLSTKETDGDLSSLLRYYIDCLKELLKKWSKSSPSCKFEHGEPRKLLEEEWNFVKTYCHSIKQEEEIVASSFCNLAEYLFDLLQSQIKSEYKLNIDVDSSPNDSPTFSNPEDDAYLASSNRRMSKNCQTYNNKCKMIQIQLKQAADFAKMLRSDLEISIQLELNSNYSMNELLSFLSATRHKMIDLRFLGEQSTINPIDLTLIIPEESSSFVKDLLDPLITGFTLQPKDDDLRAGLLNSSSSKSHRNISREYILIINRKFKINWPGEKIKFIYQLDIGNLKQRIESSNIVFLVRMPDELTEQLSNLMDYKIPCKSGNIQFKNVIQSCSEGQVEACHHKSKLTLNALKTKAIEVSQTLQTLFIYDEKEVCTGPDLNKVQEDTLRNSIKNSYSITFEFYRDLIKLCTGNAFKTVLKNTIITLLENWFKFSRRFEPSEKGTVPRWANDGLNFLFQLCQSRVVMYMTKKEWHDFKKSIDNFVEFIVGKSTRPNSNASGKSTTNSSKIIAGRSWLYMSKPELIRGCENNPSSDKKIENWKMNNDGRPLRSAFSEPCQMVKADQNIFANQNDHHTDLTTERTCEMVFTRSITVNDSNVEHSHEVPNSNKSTDGSSNADYKERKRTTLNQIINDIEKQLNEKQRQNSLIGFVRDSNSDNTSSCYIKRAPFQWIKRGLIGRGHAGTVYKVCNLDTMEVMAMKEIVINEPFSQDLFECDLLCKLNNPSLLTYYGVDISLSHMRIFTEYCESGSLSQVSILDIPEINLRQWTKQVLSAIMHLHSFKIVHRDVKPDNIFLKNIEDSNECHAKLGDFGVAKSFMNHPQGLKDIKGTIMYMAPEVTVVDSEQNKLKIGYNYKVDIWSLGCLVLYMITGKHPWDENHQLTIYYNLGKKQMPFVPDVEPTGRMTNEARDFIITCLNVNPDERPEAIDLFNYNFVK